MFGGFFQPDKEWFLDITAVVTVEHKPNLLCIWVTGKGAQQVETIPEQQLESHIDDLMQIFRSHHNVSAPYKILRFNFMQYTNDNRSKNVVLFTIFVFFI